MDKKSLKAHINKVVGEEYSQIKEIVPPTIPNTMNFWHGGDLNSFDEIISQKNGRYEYGAGLYITTHYGTAQKYAKGSRKLYLLTVSKGIDIDQALLPLDKTKEFINLYILGSKKKMLWERIQKYIVDNKVKANVFNNIILNEKAIKSSNTGNLRKFYVDNDIDYEIVDNTFGWGEKMMVLYNMKKIVNTIQIDSKDKISVYDLSTDFN